jgi:predicted DNA repair protein MutK
MSPNPQRRAWWQLVLLCLAVYGAAFATRQILVPDIVAIALAETPQSSWAVQLAFLLRAIEMTAGLSGMLLLTAAFGALVNARTAKIRAQKRMPCS